MSLADYLAKNYLTADTDASKKSSSSSKKRKRKQKDAGLLIADDDDGWKRRGGGSSDDEDAPTIVGSTAGLSLSGVKKAKKKKGRRDGDEGAGKGYTTFGVSAPSHAAQVAADEEAAAAADRIISDAVAERRRAGEEEDAAPEVVDGNGGDGGLVMESGARAGLQTAEQVEAAVRKKEDAERRDAEAAMRERGAAAQETIYRDASGRIINVGMKRAEARKKAEEEERKKVEGERAARGDVQNAEAERRRERLRDAKTMSFARGKDDVEMNEEMRAKDRWNDPAMGFLKAKKKGKSVTGKPLYQGAFQPNRYGIRPGHRWDGVDRGNGFEGEWFKARNKKANRENLEYAWQMDE
ncbi:hypothetical protein BU24DRAFT_406290 [Aaosphaeria arxii CBS 175.79]|uniref:Pre-mRNA-splicing factor CWC26 n=1 Tax=Aaosphaeria arxii CBS 175.79 TaxID=1450172 RepID=A0A6A5Y310_9PLEO|nr:uncharacterized protein BU24DRAFT_406290 [Aaosphaeria arxii CBS 175.79]KAF2019649.1 hypothetical protein BU24DRAFT_406290 [Aaosphaeria arxii CBS 175.79]